MHEGYISVDEAAQEMGIARATIWKWIKRAGLQTYRFMGERRTYVKRQDLEALRQPIPIGHDAGKRAA
jgi:excisionase family DNA binding protein